MAVVRAMTLKLLSEMKMKLRMTMVEELSMSLRVPWRATMRSSSFSQMSNCVKYDWSRKTK